MGHKACLARGPTSGDETCVWSVALGMGGKVEWRSHCSSRQWLCVVPGGAQHGCLRGQCGETQEEQDFCGEAGFLLGTLYFLAVWFGGVPYEKKAVILRG